MKRRWRRAALAAVAAAVTVVATATWPDAGTDAAAAQGPLPLPSLPVPLPSVSLPTVPLPSVALPSVPLPSLPLPSISLPPLRPPSRQPPTAAPATPPPTGPSAEPTAAPAPAGPGTPPGTGAPAGPVTGPGAGAEVVAADPGADLYPQPPMDAAVTPDARRVAALADVEHRIQYLRNVLARTRDDLATVQRQPDPVLQLLTAWTAGPAAAADPAPPLAVVDTADLPDTPTGRAAALSAAVSSGQTELTVRQREEARLRQEIDQRARATRRAATAAVTAARDAPAARLGRPLSGRLTSRYGVRFDPYYHVWQRHPGIDLAAPAGTPIVAAADGRVTRAGWYGGYGNYICVDHGRADGQRLSTCYGHQSRLLVSPGQRVRAGQVIGLVGSTGASTGPHLHFEVRLGGRAVDPLPWI